MCNKDAQRVVLYVIREKIRESDPFIISCAKRYLEMSGIENDAVICRRSERGAPWLEPEGMPFVSLSHSGDYTVCALSDGKIGVDLQKMDSLPGEKKKDFWKRLLRLAERFFHPDDTSWIRLDPEHRFFTVWSAKEAYVKYAGTGIDDSFGTFKVIPRGGPFGSAWECEGMFYEVLPFEEGYSLCICTMYPTETEIEFI